MKKERERSMAEYYLAVDIGASSGRHILGHVEDGKILLTGELELWEENPARVTPEFSGEKMEAEIEYQDGGGFSLTGVKAADVP